ncbi:uncharacterized protein CEXT_795951 [Caerostris extrusa]|uniref:Uncharacterized protein n=1 Tax=Caerostris extrusa TaxID=172846 RepID=A0AAV4S159_CAEEX|nr:uncharacterized protein CEXT_795951 [Caerostris extrusa]
MAKSLLSLLEEEFIDENLQYSSFYEENLEFLKTVSLHRVPDDLKLEVASLFLATDDYYACIGFLEDLDVDCITIKRIQFESTASLKPPLYVAFNGVLQDRKSLGDVIEVFCRKQRFDILRHLKEYVEGLLNKYNSLDKEIVCTDPSPTAPNLSSYLQGNFNHNLNHNNGSCLISCDAFQKEKTKDHKTSFKWFAEVKNNFSFANIFKQKTVINSS